MTNVTRVNPIEAHSNWQAIIRDQGNWPDFHTPKTERPVRFLPADAWDAASHTVGARAIPPLPEV